MYIPKASAQQAEFLAAVSRAARQLVGADVLSVIAALSNDWSGEPAVFFTVILSDQASRHNLLDTTKRVQHAIVTRLQPLEQWGVLPYFNFRSQSEQADIDQRHHNVA